MNDILREVDDTSNSMSITPAKSKKVKKKKKMSLSMKNSELPSIQSRSEKRTSIGMPNPNPKKARLDPKVPKKEPKSQDADMEPPENDFDDFDNFPENDDFDEDLPEMAPNQLETKPNTQSQDNVENEISKQDEKLSKMKVKDEPEPVSMETEGQLGVKREVNWNQLTQNDNTNEIEEEFDFGDDENNLVFYWLDAYENQFQRDGKIYLFGRTKEGASCCVTIQNIPHIVYFLPKDGKDFQDVYEEVDEIFEAKERFSKF